MSSMTESVRSYLQVCSGQWLGIFQDYCVARRFNPRTSDTSRNILI
jgi:hypothetical protein